MIEEFRVKPLLGSIILFLFLILDYDALYFEEWCRTGVSHCTLSRSVRFSDYEGRMSRRLLALIF